MYVSCRVDGLKFTKAEDDVGFRCSNDYGYAPLSRKCDTETMELRYRDHTLGNQPGARLPRAGGASEVGSAEGSPRNQARNMLSLGIRIERRIREGSDLASGSGVGGLCCLGKSARRRCRFFWLGGPDSVPVSSRLVEYRSDFRSVL